MLKPATRSVRDTAKYLNDYYDVPRDRRAPKGFKTLGAGSGRVAVLEKATGRVYKIGDAGQNRNESINVKRVKDYIKKNTPPVPLAVPKTKTIDLGEDAVVVMEYIKGRELTCKYDNYFDHSCRPGRCYDHVFTKLDSYLSHVMNDPDVHGNNVILKGDTFYVIDLGGYD